VHPYQWPTIGKETKHISNATLDDVKEFFYNHYAPNNAILCITGDVETEEIKNLAEKWFGPIPKRTIKNTELPKEPRQTEPRKLEVSRDVPFNSIYIAYHMCDRLHPDFATTDLISDVLSNGKSTRLYQNLVKKQNLFSNIDAFISGDIDEGLFIITGRLNTDTTFEVAEKAILNELEQLKIVGVEKYELDKVKNRVESTFTFGLTSATEKAMNLCSYELLGDANLINTTVDSYRQVSSDNIKRVAMSLFTKENSSTLYYKAEKK
jgi:predicted Zn-dependent peptidase